MPSEDVRVMSIPPRAQLVHAFESVLPVLQQRVIDWENVPPSGHIARMDNDLYFQTIRIPSLAIWSNVVRFGFLAFPAADGSFLTPPIGAVSRVGCVWWGVRVSPRGGLFDTGEDRANLRRVQKNLHASDAGMALYEAAPNAKYLVTTFESHPLEPDDPRRWGKAMFTVLPKRFNGERGYDWPSLARRILDNLDDVRTLLAAAWAPAALGPR